MIQSQIDTEIQENEFRLIKEIEHIDIVYSKIEENLDKYLLLFREYMETECALNSTRESILAYIKEIIDGFEGERIHYEKFFERNKIFEEYYFDINTFKSDLRRLCPVIRACCNSRSEVMKKWNAAFKRSKPADIYDIFCNIIQFGDDYNDNYESTSYSNIDTWEDFGFGDLNDENHRLLGVIGSGIIATVLNALFPHIFPGSFRQGLYALYFISDKETFGMYSGTSEFIMVKDSEKKGCMSLDHNYFYYYEVYSLYCLRLYKKINEFFKQWDIMFPEEYRYVLTGKFYDFICFNVHEDDIATLSGNDDLEKYGRLWQM